MLCESLSPELDDIVMTPWSVLHSYCSLGRCSLICYCWGASLRSHQKVATAANNELCKSEHFSLFCHPNRAPPKDNPKQDIQRLLPQNYFETLGVSRVQVISLIICLHIRLGVVLWLSYFGLPLVSPQSRFILTLFQQDFLRELIPCIITREEVVYRLCTGVVQEGWCTVSTSGSVSVVFGSCQNKVVQIQRQLYTVRLNTANYNSICLH